jgi:hypothetical protein
MNSIRRHLNYANVVATMALVFAMSGTAVAAKHYLINSTKQIKPSVLKSLKGKTGKTGPQGPAGTPGSPGLTGKEGSAGLSALSPLPSGDSESGSWQCNRNPRSRRELPNSAGRAGDPGRVHRSGLTRRALQRPRSCRKRLPLRLQRLLGRAQDAADHHEHGNTRPRRRGTIWLSHRMGTHRIRPGSGGHLHRDSAVGPQLVDQTPSRCQTFRAPRRASDRAMPRRPPVR